MAREVQARLAGMAVGDRLPPEREFCAELGVSRVTLRKAMESLHREGFLQTRRGGGTRLARVVAPPRKAGLAAHRLIGLVVPTVENSLISRVVRGAEALAAERGFHVALAHDHGDMDYQLKQLRRMLEGGVSGVAVYPDTGNVVRSEFRDLIRRFEAQSIPLVMIDRYVPDVEAPSVMSDNVAGMYAATEHLILSGHRRLALLSFGDEGGVADRERRKGFVQALQDYGLPAQAMREAALGTRGHEESAREAVAVWLAEDAAQVLQENSGLTADGVLDGNSFTSAVAASGGGAVRPRFDGIVCMQDNMAYGAFLALRDAGLSVPEDVSLVGYDNLDRELFQAAGLHLTSVDQPAEEIGQQAAALLIDRIEGAPGAIAASPVTSVATSAILPRSSGKLAQHVLLKPRLVVRES
ncbi:GntR family transcriptional regulator [Opitutaceae bacterium TAV4]|nr:GntR family transcriptional regulator [Opitutaceae bacterium TAV4]RRK00664.1 GntR family transcriptional regulator [Opitutaceae bacterium TAV3]